MANEDELVFRLKNEVSSTLAQVRTDVGTTTTALSRMAKQASDDIRNMTARMSTANADGQASAKMLTLMGQAGQEAFRKLHPELDAVTRGMSAAGQQATASGKLLAGMSQSGRSAAAALEASLKPIPQQLTLADKAAGLARSTFGQMFGAFTAANLATSAITALGRGVVSMGREAFESAAQIADLSATTGLGTTAIQQMDYVAKQTSTTLEAFTSASYTLGLRLSGDDASVASAVKRLGFSLETLRAMKPDEQFMRMVDALGQVRTETERNELGNAAFGRGFKAIAAAVGQGYRDMASDASVSSRAQIDALDQAGDAWDRLKARTKTRVRSALGNIAADFEGPREGFAEGLARMIGDVQTPAGFVGAGLGWGAALPPEWEVAKLTKETDALQGTAAASIERAAKAAAALAEATRKAGEAAYWASKQQITWNQSLADFQHRGGVAKSGLVDGVLGGHGFNPTMFMAEFMGDDGIQAFLSDPSNDIRNNPGMLSWEAKQARERNLAAKGGGPFSSLFGGITGGLGSMWKGMTGTNDAGKSLGMSGLFSNIGGGLVSNLASGGLNSLISVGMQGVGKLFGKLSKSEGKATNNLRDEKFDSLGGFEAVAKRAAELGIAMDTLLKPSKVKDFEAAWGNLTTAMEKQTALLERYNVIWSDFKGEEQTKRFDAQLRMATADYDGLIRAGLDHETALKKVGPLYAEMAVAAVRAGREIPPALAPALRELAEMNRLTSEQVAGLLGIAEASGPTFGEMEAAAGRLGIKLEELGGRYQQLRTTDAADKLAKDFGLLREGGTDVNVLFQGMKEEVSALIQEALKYGVTIPDSIKPVVERMQEQGLITDEAGQKLEDLSKIQFAAPLVSEVDKLIAKLDELIASIKGVPDAFQSLPDHLDGVEPWRGWPGNVAEIEEKHRGGMLWRTAHRGWLVGSSLQRDEVPIIGQTGERVLSRAELAVLGGPQAVNAAISQGGFSGGTSSGAPVDMAGLRQDFVAHTRRLERSFQRAIETSNRRGRDAVLKRGRVA